MKKLIKSLLISILLLIGISIQGISQSLPRVNKPFPEFNLKSRNGNIISLPELKGKNILLVFPRGKVGDHWCHLCHYQYAELAKAEIEHDIRENYNLEILYILPYTMDDVNTWVGLFPSQMAEIQSWKDYPKDKLNPSTLAFVAAVEDVMSFSFKFDEDNPAPLPFPILADENHQLSTKLKLYTSNWDSYYNEQNVPTIFILDEEGLIKFKYVSQETFDRLPASYIIEVLDRVL